MLVFMFILIAIIFVGIQTAGKDKFYSDYCSPKQTTAINGIFVVLVFFTHVAQYLKLTDPLTTPYMSFKKYMAQLVVVTFLFYSGYGMTESIKKKGTDYVKGIPTKRLFRIWYHFAIAVSLFAIWNLIFDKSYPISKTLLAYTGWTSIGNSDWYMLATFVLYICMFIAFMIFRKSKVAAVILTSLLCFAFIMFQRKMGRPGYCYNTMMCFPAGMFFSLIKPYFDKLFLKNDIIWVLGLGASFGLFYYFGTLRGKSVIFYTLWALFAAALVLFITIKVKIQNSILDWFGHHVFSIYILQRLSMNTFSYFGLNKSHPYAFVILCFVITIILSILFDSLMEKTDSLIYNRKKKAPAVQTESENKQSVTASEKV